MTSDLPAVQEADWKSKAYVLSGVTGLVVGLLAAYFYVRVSEEHGASNPRRIKTMDMIGLAVTLLSIIRQITDLGADGGKK
jgi:hypothetical protein